MCAHITSASWKLETSAQRKTETLPNALLRLKQQNHSITRALHQGMGDFSLLLQGEEPNKTPGVVVIDELDLRLYPV